MDKAVTSRSWWDDLKLEAGTARLVAERVTSTPAELAGLARAAPEAFRDVFGPLVRADLARALAAHLADDRGDDEGFADLRDALEEVAGKRPLKPPTNLPKVGFGAEFPVGPNPKVAPLPKLPKLGPNKSGS